MVARLASIAGGYQDHVTFKSRDFRATKRLQVRVLRWSFFFFAFSGRSTAPRVCLIPSENRKKSNLSFEIKECGTTCVSEANRGICFRHVVKKARRLLWCLDFGHPRTAPARQRVRNNLNSPASKHRECTTTRSTRHRRHSVPSRTRVQVSPINAQLKRALRATTSAARHGYHMAACYERMVTSILLPPADIRGRWTWLSGKGRVAEAAPEGVIVGLHMHFVLCR